MRSAIDFEIKKAKRARYIGAFASSSLERRFKFETKIRIVYINGNISTKIVKNKKDLDYLKKKLKFEKLWTYGIQRSHELLRYANAYRPRPARMEIFDSFGPELLKIVDTTSCEINEMAEFAKLMFIS